MKNMKKFVAAFAAAAMVMSMGVSAFADVIAPGKVVDETTGDMTHITFFVDGEDISKNDEENQITLLAYLIPEINPATQQPYTAETIPAYSNQTIIALDQVGGSAGFGEVPVDTKKLEEGYAIAVMLGGSDGTVAQGIITYNEESGDSPITITFKWGDVNLSGAADGIDYGDVLSASVGGKQSFTTTKDDTTYTFTWNTNEVEDSTGKKYTFVGPVWGDVNMSGAADGIDYGDVLSASVGGKQTFTDGTNTYTWNTDVTITLTEKN